jgi:hypothetical protein
MMKCGIAALSLFFKNINDRIPYFDIRYSLFQSFFFDLTGRCSDQRRRLYETTMKVSGVSVQVSGNSALSP